MHESLPGSFPLFANSLAPAMLFMPGPLVPAALGLAIPASVLAAFIERPFFTAAGVHTHPLRYALRANLYSLLVGFLTFPGSLLAITIMGYCWTPFGIAISVLVERWYLRRAGFRELDVLPIIVGNCVSTLTLIVLPSVSLEVIRIRPSVLWEYEPYFGPMWWVAVVGGCFVFLVCLIPRKNRSPGSQALPGNLRDEAPPR